MEAVRQSDRFFASMKIRVQTCPFQMLYYLKTEE
nr:MAG TPA: hypothetical protein [Caudoviricetes sp.]